MVSKKKLWQMYINCLKIIDILNTFKITSIFNVQIKEKADKKNLLNSFVLKKLLLLIMRLLLILSNFVKISWKKMLFDNQDNIDKMILIV